MNSLYQVGDTFQNVEISVFGVVDFVKIIIKFQNRGGEWKYMLRWGTQEAWITEADLAASLAEKFVPESRDEEYEGIDFNTYLARITADWYTDGYDE